MMTADQARAELAKRMDFVSMLNGIAEKQIEDAIEQQASKVYISVARAKFLKLCDSQITDIITRWARGWGYEVKVNRMDRLGTQYAFVGFWLSWEVKET